jgi:DNA invertase Pin-like site-specific DNA recombinase
MLRAFAYLRVSTVEQEYSPEAQLRQCRLYAEMRGYEIVGVFEETAVSGAVAFDERPRGRELLARVGEVDAVIFAKLDRAFRNTVDCLMTVRQLSDAGKTIHFIDLAIDTSTAPGKLILSVMVAFAEFERQRIGERTKEALAVARSRGTVTGPAPFGYDNVVEIGRRVHRKNDVEWETVTKIRQLADAGASSHAIARILNSQGVATRLGGQWSARHVIRILAREARAQ